MAVLKALQDEVAEVKDQVSGKSGGGKSSMIGLQKNYKKLKTQLVNKNKKEKVLKAEVVRLGGSANLGDGIAPSSRQQPRHLSHGSGRRHAFAGRDAQFRNASNHDGRRAESRGGGSGGGGGDGSGDGGGAGGCSRGCGGTGSGQEKGGTAGTGRGGGCGKGKGGNGGEGGSGRGRGGGKGSRGYFGKGYYSQR